MYKNYWLFLLLITGANRIVAQNSTIKINGTIIDSLTNQPLPYATVQLASGALKVTEVSDVSGSFNFKKLSKGSYSLIVSYVGYISKILPLHIDEQQNAVQVPTIALNLANINLAGLTIKAVRPFIEQNMDKIILNVSESIMANSGSSLDILRRAPSVQVNESDGSITLKGKKVMILIDGKLTQLTGESLEGLLSSMPSNSIDQIEFMSNPSAKYEASGMAIVNIKTLKMRGMGVNGSYGLGVSIGKYFGYNGNVLLNYRRNKFTFSGNYSHQLLNQYVDIQSFRTLQNQYYFGDEESYHRVRRLQLWV